MQRQDKLLCVPAGSIQEAQPKMGKECLEDMQSGLSLGAGLLAVSKSSLQLGLGKPHRPV